MQLGLSINPCNLCPRHCGVDRTIQHGFCGAPAEPAVATVTIHKGEEPPLAAGNGIVNIFFAHCNLQCIYCQNHDISSATVDPSFVHYSSVDSLADRVCQLLPQSNGLMGFVTAAHYAHLIAPLVDAVHKRGFYPTVVYNSSGYESIDTLRALEGIVDIYLPDIKYFDADLAQRYSHAADYPLVATQAILEMQRQVGSSLKMDDNGVAFRGLIIRHLVLPGQTANTLQCLEWLADHFFATKLHVSLMAQYYPPMPGLPAPIDRTLTAAEYDLAVQHFQQLGFNGWLQTPDANTNYRPDFSDPDTPFKSQR